MKNTLKVSHFIVLCGVIIIPGTIQLTAMVECSYGSFGWGWKVKYSDGYAFTALKCEANRRGFSM